MYSDGFIQNKRKHNNYRVGITLSYIDREHLEKFKKCIEFTGPVKTYTPIKTSYNTKPYSKIIVSSNKMAEDLINKGCLLNKTNKLIYPNE